MHARDAVKPQQHTCIGILALFAAILTLAGCEYPRDAEGTLERVRAEGVLRASARELALLPGMGVSVAAGMYMMVLQNSVKFFGDATINIDPDARALAEIAVQMADQVASFRL